MKLDYIIAGAQKSGTTTLHNLIRAHKDAFTPPTPQELHFFDHSENYSRGMNWFEAHFKDHKDEAVIGQTSPLYIYHPQAAKRIHQSFPEVKLIFILRNPVERAYSHYYHSVKKGYETLSFEAAINQEAERIQKDTDSRSRFSYQDRGFYHQQLSEYLKYFKLNQIKVLQTEKLKIDPVTELDAIFRFLEIPEDGQKILAEEPNSQRNISKIPRSRRVQQFAAQYRKKLPSICRKIDRLNLVEKPYPPIPPQLRIQIAETFKEDTARLCKLFQLESSIWK